MPIPTSFALSQIIAAKSAQPDNDWPSMKDGRVGSAAAAVTSTGFWTSLWLQNGAPNGAGVAPGAAAVPTRTTAGALLQLNPTPPAEKWLLGFSLAANSAGTLRLYDRLLHNSGLSGTSVAAQAVGGPALTRYTNGVGNQIWIEIYTQIGATIRSVTASYTNQDGVAGRTTPSRQIGGTGYREAQRMLQFALQAGDYGVRSVESVTIDATTGTVGDFGVTITHDIGEVAFDEAGVGAVRDYISAVPGPPEIQTDACLTWAWFAATAGDTINFDGLTIFVDM